MLRYRVIEFSNKFSFLNRKSTIEERKGRVGWMEGGISEIARGRGRAAGRGQGDEKLGMEARGRGGGARPCYDA